MLDLHGWGDPYPEQCEQCEDQEDGCMYCNNEKAREWVASRNLPSSVN